jgi:hypothetical protein
MLVLRIRNSDGAETFATLLQGDAVVSKRIRDVPAFGPDFSDPIYALIEYI